MKNISFRSAQYHDSSSKLSLPWHESHLSGSDLVLTHLSPLRIHRKGLYLFTLSPFLTIGLRFIQVPWLVRSWHGFSEVICFQIIFKLPIDLLQNGHIDSDSCSIYYWTAPGTFCIDQQRLSRATLASRPVPTIGEAALIKALPDVACLIPSMHGCISFSRNGIREADTPNNWLGATSMYSISLEPTLGNHHGSLDWSFRHEEAGLIYGVFAWAIFKYPLLLRQVFSIPFRRLYHPPSFYMVFQGNQFMIWHVRTE